MDHGIFFDEKEELFSIQMKTTTYIIGLANGYLGHIYYGSRINGLVGKESLRLNDYTFMNGEKKDKCTFMDSFPFEYGTAGIGDFRTAALSVRNEAGFSGVELKYISHNIYNGKKKLNGLPSTFGDEGDTTSLDILLSDTEGLIEVTLTYSIFKDSDILAKSVRVNNSSDQKLYIEKLMSSSVDMPYEGQEIITLHGSWARERAACRRDIGHGRIEISSKRGISSHQEHPFMAFAKPGTSENIGEVLGMCFVYSGNFLAEVERNQSDTLRANMGIGDYDFSWKLDPGETIDAPEVLLCYSTAGLGNMSREFHNVMRDHLIRSPYLHKKRPILINNWEATYFDFNEEKLLEIARQAKSCGIEMLVMDDGWFGKRDSDNCSLGDWVVDKRKLPDGLTGLCKKINDMGLDMGIWFEPEMISPDSDLYRAHPDWVIAIPGRENSECRSQFVLDLTRSEVREYVYECVAKVLRETNIKYVKWDMNRPLTDVGSTVTRGGEIHHRYMLGVYELMERLTSEFPDLLLENCSSGGGRFDAGMLYYSPQIWCSDDTDAMERLKIQEGTALIYPPSAIGAHVSICPNHLVGRTTDMTTRGYVALLGTFGYELDITKLSDEDKEIIKEQVADYHRFNDLIREGDYYRITSDGGLYTNYSVYHSYSWMFVSKDKKEALLTYVQERGTANMRPQQVKLVGLDPKKIYRLDDGRSFSGDELVHIGFVTDKLWGDGKGRLYHFVEE
ncbi:MAG: alpha-galactosidase [Lachnospiraceae bacterium]|nr:alpha-galactosidase [Lachnospiraceae bacterium]